VLFRSNTGVLTGESNIAIGHLAGKNVTTADTTIAIGKNAIGLGVLTGDNNVAIGNGAGTDLTSGASNAFVGYVAGGNVTTGVDNTILGANAGISLTTGSNNTIIGHDAAPTSATVSNEITLGSTNANKFRVPGVNFTIKDSTATEDYVLTVDANGEAGWEAAGGAGFPNKAWVNFDSRTTLSITDSGNVSSVTDNSTGNFTVNFSSNLSSAGYALAGYGVAYSVSNVSGFTQFGLVPTGTNTKIPVTKSTSAVRILMGNPANGIPADAGDYSLTAVA